jgi:hypothetical protein
MDTTFISGLLFMCLLAILGLYLYQSTPSLHMHSSNSKNSSNSSKKGSEAFFPVIFDTCPRMRMSGMPVHRVGPVHNFHQHFNKYAAGITCSKNPASIPEAGTVCNTSYPTGIPEMGWRNWYLTQYSQNQVPPQDPFQGTSVRNYLDNMSAEGGILDNVYRKCT